MGLSRDKILGHVDTRIGRVAVAELGGDVCVANLTVEEADRFSKAEAGGMSTVVALVILGACTEDGERLFTDADAAALGKLPASALNKVAKKVLEHNSMGAGAVDDAKNASSETASGDSASASPSNSEKPSRSSRKA